MHNAGNGILIEVSFKHSWQITLLMYVRDDTGRDSSVGFGDKATRAV